MATHEQRAALLAVPCTWCGASPGEPCSVRRPSAPDEDGITRSRPRAVTTLDGGAHERRWQTALGVSAPVLAPAVAERTERPVSLLPDPEPVPVGSGAGERPW